MKKITTNHLFLCIPMLILSTSIISAFCILAFCLRSIIVGLLLLPFSLLGWSGVITAFTRFYDKLMNFWLSKSRPYLAVVWFLISLLVSLSFGLDNGVFWNAVLFASSIIISSAIPLLIIQSAMGNKIKSWWLHSTKSESAVIHPTL